MHRHGYYINTIETLLMAVNDEIKTFPERLFAFDLINGTSKHINLSTHRTNTILKCTNRLWYCSLSNLVIKYRQMLV